MTSNTAITTLDGAGTIPAYVARSDLTPRGAVIVIQEIFGVNPGIRKKADDWAAKGYLAVAPEVFWRQKPGIELDADVPEQFQEGVGYMMKHDFDLGTQDIEAVIHWVRREQGVAKIGLVGFCMGGRIAYLAATRTDLDAAVGYYGVGIDQMLDEAQAIAKALLLHVPTADGFVPPEAQAKMHAGLDDNPHVILYDYDGLDHGFAAEHGVRRNEAAARLADQRTEEFIAQYVG